MTQITQISTARGSMAGTGTESLTGEPIPFTSTCPRCTREQHQRGFARAALRRLLDKGYPIEAYCVMCDQFWAVGPGERATLRGALSRPNE
jgi:hypothetical protein